MSYLRSVLFKVEKYLNYINEKFWDVMIIVNKYINHNIFIMLLYILTLILIIFWLYSLLNIIY